MSAPMDDWLSDFIATERLPADFAGVLAKICEPLARDIAARAGGGAYTVGLCGAQGSGKSTMAVVVAYLLESWGFSVAVLSLDDLYLTAAERGDLAASVHPLLAIRGAPGTHDIDLGRRLLHALAAEGPVALPSFDKAADDRRPVAEWPVIEAPVDVILLEGWCVGARPQPPADLVTPINSLERDEDPQGLWRAYVNAALAGPYQTLFGRIDHLVLLRAPSFEVVLAWRREQETKLRQRLIAQGLPRGRAMSDEAVARFIAHYERLTRWILAEMPGRADAVIALDAARRPL